MESLFVPTHLLNLSWERPEIDRLLALLEPLWGPPCRKKKQPHCMDPLPPAPDWAVSIRSVQLECLYLEPASPGNCPAHPGTHFLSLLSCLQERVILVYKCIYLVTMRLCVYESDTMQTLKCLIKWTYEFIENLI